MSGRRNGSREGVRGGVGGLSQAESPRGQGWEQTYLGSKVLRDCGSFTAGVEVSVFSPTLCRDGHEDSVKHTREQWPSCLDREASSFVGFSSFFFISLEFLLPPNNGSPSCLARLGARYGPKPAQNLRGEGEGAGSGW